MQSLYWIFVMLPAVTRPHSGDGDVEPRISCTSDITTERRILTCKVVGGGNEDDEDEEEADSIEKMTACYTDFSTKTVQTKCVTGSGDTIDSRELSLILDLNVTVHFNGGGQITRMIDMTKIVKPKSPQVWNVSLNQESNQVLIHIRTPYHKEYLQVRNQLFQLLIWSSESTTIQNLTSSEHIVMKIDVERFCKNTQYHIKVRAIPLKDLQGTWSEWSNASSFFTPGEDKIPEQMIDRWKMYALAACIFLAVVSSSALLVWKNKIFSYMWPRIPHPKHTLVQICKPNKGLILNFQPEVISALRIYPVEKTEERPHEKTEPMTTGSADEGAPSGPPCSTQSSDGSASTTSVSTVELELSALLSRSSSDEEDTCSSSSNAFQRPPTPQAEASSGGQEAEVIGGSQQEEAYVTMSSLYHIN
ncbi:interleukin-7 receptor subunit alpha [Brachionichthys hirsutus]|uniref:interleukin-7 receptor subunit alpha n=1 Tax=Brachionichthys hirsutus TaxID=412623 RepID=UPI003604BF6E